MVATLLKIQYRVLGNTLSRHPWQLVGFLVSALAAAGSLLFVAVGLLLLGSLGLDVARAVIVAAGAVITVVWALAPIIAGGIDTTLDPAKLAAFPMTPARMMLALTVAGALGLAGLTTLLGGMATLATWWRWPAAAGAALVCVPLGVAICVVASRTVASLAGGLGSGRRAREAIGLVLFALVLFASPIMAGLGSAVSTQDAPLERIRSILDAVSWTPLGAAWAVPGDLAAGAPLPAAMKMLIALATLVALSLLWHRSLAASLVAPPARSAGRRVGAGKLGWFGRMPAGPVGATWARSLTYWTRDARYLRQLLLVPFAPAMILLYTNGDPTHDAFPASAILAAFFLGIAPYTDISYDGTAFGTVLQTGITGRADRLGRMLGAASLGIPLVLLLAVITVAIAGDWSVFPAVAGAALGMLLTAYGLCAISSAALIVPVPAAGANPFTRVPGATFTMGLAFLGLWLLSLALAAPGVVLAILAITLHDPLYGWLALAVAPALGLAVFAAGVVLGGRMFDRAAPALLLRLKSLKGV